MAILNLYQSFWEKLSENFRMTIFGHSKLIPVIFGKIVRKIQNGHFWPFQIYSSLFGKSYQKKFGTPIFGHSKFILVFLGKSEKHQKSHFWPFQIYTSLFGKNLQKIFRMAILNLYQSFGANC